jgi:hypothetical protein
MIFRVPSSRLPRKIAREARDDVRTKIRQLVLDLCEYSVAELVRFDTQGPRDRSVACISSARSTQGGPGDLVARNSPSTPASMRRAS